MVFDRPDYCFDSEHLTGMVTTFDRRVPLICFACGVATMSEVDVWTLMAVSQPLVSCARGVAIRNSSKASGGYSIFYAAFLSFPYSFRVMKRARFRADW